MALKHVSHHVDLETHTLGTLPTDSLGTLTEATLLISFECQPTIP